MKRTAERGREPAVHAPPFQSSSEGSLLENLQHALVTTGDKGAPSVIVPHCPVLLENENGTHIKCLEFLAHRRYLTVYFA